jgi:hypothetical protein
MGTDLYILALAVGPLFAWDVIRNRRVHEAYGIRIAVYVPTAVLINLLWDTPWWHATARQLMGV